MPKIHVLDRATAELIAAGEVVERPASAMKELIENAIDAGAKHITAEIERGGVSLMRVTDDGCGIAKDDVKVAFLRHATSKIQTEADLDAIGTLGFRGEALAAISAVSRVRLITRRTEDEIGTLYELSGGAGGELSEIGCAAGTVIEVRDLFYNTPARMKFLKKDMKEGANVSAMLERMALSHPEIAFKLIKDGKVTLSTQGNGDLKDAVYSVLGRDIALGTLPIHYEGQGVTVEGLICKPFKCRPNRNLQIVFLNGRFVKSGTVMAALDVGYKNSAMVGKFPYCVLNISMPYEAVDVNVHPAKTEVRFADESRVFDAVRFGVRAALAADTSRPEMNVSKEKAQIRMTSQEFLREISGDKKPISARSVGQSLPLPMDDKKILLNAEKPPLNAGGTREATDLASAADGQLASASKSIAADRPTADLTNSSTPNPAAKKSDGEIPLGTTFMDGEGNAATFNAGDHHLYSNQFPNVDIDVVVDEEEPSKKEYPIYEVSSGVNAPQKETPQSLAHKMELSALFDGDLNPKSADTEERFLEISSDEALTKTPEELKTMAYREPEDLKNGQSGTQNGSTPNADLSAAADDTPLIPKTARFIGELFRTYILAEYEGKLILIDKHATHERMLFEQQKSAHRAESQMLAFPETINLSANEYATLLDNLPALSGAGFELEDFGDGAVVLRAVPSMLALENHAGLLSEIAESLQKTGSVTAEKLDHIYHTVACKAACKAGYVSSDVQLIKLMEEALYNPKIRYCPHGRPVAIEISGREIEKMFGRLG